MNEIALDLTPWVRGPFTGVGLSAMRTFRALQELGVSCEAVSRDAHADLRKLGVMERVLGDPRKTFHGFGVSLPPIARSRVVLTVHDLWTLAPNPYQAPEFQKRQAPRLVKAIARADVLATPTAAVRDELARLRPDIPIAVIPWAPLLDDAGPRAHERPYFLCVASLETRKNLPLLCEALRGEREIDLVLVGAPGFGATEALAALDALRASGTRVTHHEKLAEPVLAALYRDAIALVQSSRDEGFGMPVVEAMRFGTPVVLSAIPAFREIAADAALYFDSTEALREALKKIALERERYSLRALERVKLFTWRKTAEAYRALYGR